MQSGGQKLPYLFQQVYQIDSCIHLVPPKIKPRIYISFLKIHSPPPPISANLIHYLVLKNLKMIHRLTLIKPTQSLFPIKLLYHF